MAPNSRRRVIEFDAIRDLPDRRFLQETDIHPVERVLCTRLGDTMQADVRIECETATERFSLEERLYVMSPAGFEFGYRGAGPRALAWNVLGLLLPPKEAHRLSQRFKEAFVAPLDRDGGAIDMIRVRAWIRGIWADELADLQQVAEEAELRRLLAEIDAADHIAREEDGGCEPPGP